MLCFNVKQNSTSDFDTIMDGQQAWWVEIYVMSFASKSRIAQPANNDGPCKLLVAAWEVERSRTLLAFIFGKNPVKLSKTRTGYQSRKKKGMKGSLIRGNGAILM